VARVRDDIARVQHLAGVRELDVPEAEVAERAQDLRAARSIQLSCMSVSWLPVVVDTARSRRVDRPAAA